MPTYQVGNAVYQSDKPLSDDDLGQLTGGGGQQPPSQGVSQPQPALQGNPVTSDLQQASSSLDAFNPSANSGGGQSQPIMGAPQNPGDVLINLLGQFGKGVYSNPIVHPALKALGDWAGANPDAAYAGVGDPQSIGEKVASGLGGAAPLMAVAGPMGLGIDAATGALAIGTKAIPILGRITSMLGDSQLAKSALTGLAYGAAEGKAMQAQGQQVDVGQNAMNTAGQFLFWSALSKGGASLASKFIPKNILNQPDILKNTPLIGQATKNFFTPEGLGSIAGGALAGAISSPDSKSGIAGAIVGGALSSMNPADQYQFRQGLGKSLGFRGVSAVTDHMGKSFAEANDIFEQFGYNDVEKAGMQQQQVPNPVGGTDTVSTPQIAAQAHMDALNKIKTQKQGLFDQALQSNENIKPQSVRSFTSLLQQRVNEIKDPTSPVVTNFNRTLERLRGMDLSYTTMEETPKGEQSPQGFYSPRTLVTRDLPPALRAKIMEQQQANSPQITLNALHQLKMSMQEMVSPEVWVGNRAMTPDERDANNISQSIGNYIGKNNNAYAEASRQYSVFKKIQAKAYGLDGMKLSQNMLAMDGTKREMRENDLNQIGKYLTDNGQASANSTNLLKKYYAYQTYNDPSTTGFAKSYLIREGIGSGVGALLHFSGLSPIASLAGGVAGYEMSNPKAWLPALKGASMAKDLKSFRGIAARLSKR